MATNISEWASAGLHCIQIGARDANGVFQGFGKLTTADTGDVSGMRHIQGAVTAPTPVPGVNRVYPRDDDRYHGGFTFDAQPSEFGIEFEATDLDVAAFIGKKSLYTLGNWDILNSGNANRQYQDCVMLFSREAQSWESASDGSPGYDNLLIPSTKFTRNRGNAAFQAVGSNVLNGIASPVQTSLWKKALIDLLGDSDGLTWEWWSQYVPTFVSFVGDNSLAVIPLPVTPVDAASTKWFNGSTGAALTVSSVSVGSDTATVSVAPASGLMTVGMLETPDL